MILTRVTQTNIGKDIMSETIKMEILYSEDQLKGNNKKDYIIYNFYFRESRKKNADNFFFHNIRGPR